MFKRYVFVEGLTSLFGSDGSCLINILGQVKDKMGNDLPVTRDQDGHKVVHCHGWDGVRVYRVIDLVAIQFKSLQIPVKDFNKVEAFVADNNPDNTHAVNVGYRFKGGKLEVEEHPGFYYVPAFTRVAINEAGQVLDVGTQKIKNTYVTKPNPDKNIKGGYILVGGIRFCQGNFVSSTRHRLLCLVFKEYPNNVDSMDVNHIDGVPGNDWLENLEWVSRSQNNTHAYVNDLKNQHHRVLARDVLTGNVEEFYSVCECARALGYPTDETIRSRLYRCPFGKVFQDGKQFKLKSDGRPWVIPENPVEAVREAQENIPVKVRSCETLEVKSYATVSDAARETEVNRSTLQLRLKSNNDKPLFGYQFKREEDDTPWSYFTREEHLSSLKPNSSLVLARNLLTGETAEFSSIRKAAEKLMNSDIPQKLREGKQPLLDSGWQLKLPHWEWEEIPDFEEAIYKLRREIMAKEEATGKFYIGSDSQQLATMLKLDPKGIRKAAMTRGHRVYKGYRFRLGISWEPWPDTVTAK